MPKSYDVTERTRIKRYHENGTYDRETIHNILDATPLCHLGFLRSDKPAIIPTLQWREGDYVYWHGSKKSQAMLNSCNQEVCLTVTLLDGMVMSRSAFAHSVNYRSVIVYGKAESIEEPEAKAEKLKNMFDKIFPGRWEHLRTMREKEVKATSVFSLAIKEVSAKVRTGEPVDFEEDYELPIWAGVIPISQQIHPAEPDSKNHAGLEIPEHINNFRLG